MDHDARVMLLRAIGLLKRDKQPDPEFVNSLFAARQGDLHCPQCGDNPLQSLAAKPSATDIEEDDEQWGMARRCSVCRQTIPTERLEVLPDTDLCNQCARSGRTKEGEETREFCPRCGGLMKISTSGGAGLSRYQMRCQDCGYR